MVQTSNESSGKAYVEVRGDMRYYHNPDPQKHKGWYWCHEKRGYFRHSDWHLTIEEMERKYG